MIIELYAAQPAEAAGAPDLPVSNLQGELPEQEPALDMGDLLGSFPSREEAMNFVQYRAAAHQREVVDTHSAPFNDYVHIEWLTVTFKNEDQSTHSEGYYLVSDEGY
ncbi:hypothetical protein HNV11_11620 [Spirosoma taeanense]|uniref:Uncharacterized protein n=1 Tax=Spirosoma taeanense TaxID=2735870 RepID=A0A6M5Y6B6_9BACT|nr:hypothetical protein [Spirosoma taeanense]QJW89977.1 hypothetical protein HNV11_11620 [Spirosoma taeanense]